MSCFGAFRRRKNRLMLAVALVQPSNFLVLDEPTNDLDMDTLDLLQEVLDEYEGTILLVSHDRDFIDRVVTSVIYMPGDGSVSVSAPRSMFLTVSVRLNWGLSFSARYPAPAPRHFRPQKQRYQEQNQFAHFPPYLPSDRLLSGTSISARSLLTFL